MATNRYYRDLVQLNTCLLLILDAGYLDIHGIKNLDEAIQCSQSLSSQPQHVISFAVDHYFPASLGSSDVMTWLNKKGLSLTKINFSPISGWSGGALDDRYLTNLISNSTNLIVCHLDQNMHVTDASICLLLDSCSCLEELSVKYLMINGSGFSTGKTKLHNMRKLDLRGCLFLNDDGMVTFTERIPNLTEISFSDSQRVTNMTLIALANNCYNLEELHIERMINITDDSITLLAEHNPNLRKVTLDALYNTSQKVISIRVINFCPLLQVYMLRTLDELFEIEDTIVIQLVSNCPHIMKLHMYSDHVHSISALSDQSIRAITNTLQVSLVSLRLDIDSSTTFPDDLRLTDFSNKPTDPFECLVKQCKRLEMVDLRRKASGLGDWYYKVLN
jgi:hypothetical protein